MTSFWPLGMDLRDVQTPHEILKQAQLEWKERSEGLLGLIIQETETTTQEPMLIVHAVLVPTNRTVELFSVVHRIDSPYPARIQPRENALPDFLKKKHYEPGIADLHEPMVLTGREVTNKWVCDTPSEFRDQLRQVFELGTVKSDVLNLVSSNKLSASPLKKSEKVKKK